RSRAARGGDGRRRRHALEQRGPRAALLPGVRARRRRPRIVALARGADPPPRRALHVADARRRNDGMRRIRSFARADHGRRARCVVPHRRQADCPRDRTLQRPHRDACEHRDPRAQTSARSRRSARVLDGGLLRHADAARAAPVLLGARVELEPAVRAEVQGRDRASARRRSGRAALRAARRRQAPLLRRRAGPDDAPRRRRFSRRAALPRLRQRRALGGVSADRRACAGALRRARCRRRPCTPPRRRPHRRGRARRVARDAAHPRLADARERRDRRACRPSGCPGRGRTCRANPSRRLAGREARRGRPRMSAVAMLVFIAVLFVVLLLAAAMLTWIERRVLAWWQDRYGPNRAGPFGILQALADVIKLLLKEDWIPPLSDKPVFVIAPAIVAATMLVAFAVVPFAPGLVIADLNIALLFFLAMTGLSVYSVTFAGWASNNNYALLGSLRTAAQMISYEVFMGLSLVGVVILAGSFSLVEIVEAQRGMWYFVPQFVGLVVFFLAAIAETHRLPFDLPEAEH